MAKSKKCLLIRTDRLGDMVLTTPLIRAMALKGWAVDIYYSNVGNHLYVWELFRKKLSSSVCSIMASPDQADGKINPQ
jgi:hypothetical protein